MGITYFLLDEELNRVKIGHTEKQPLGRRVKQVKYNCLSHSLKLIAFLPNTTFETEDQYKRLFSSQLISKTGVGNEEMFYHKGIVKSTLNELQKGNTMKDSVIKLTITTIREYLKFINSAKCKLNAIFQRNLVWKPKEEMQLVNSVLCGYPIGQFDYAVINGVHNCIDSQQRSTTLRKVKNDEIPYRSQLLDKLNTDKTFDELDGLVFSEWPEVYQQKFLNTEIAVWSKKTTEEEASSMFRILNIYMNRMKAEEIIYSNDPRGGMNILKKKLADHPYWSKVFTQDNINRKEVECTIGQYIKAFVTGTGEQRKGLSTFMKDNSDAKSDAIKGAAEEIALYRDILDKALPSKEGFRAHLSSRASQYSLFYLLHEMHSNGKVIKDLDKFSKRLNEIQIKLNAKDYVSTEIEMYKNSTQRDKPDSKENRDKRVTVLKLFLMDCFE